MHPEQQSGFDDFIVKMVAAFGAPETGDRSTFKQLLRDKVGGYGAATLDQTAEHFIESRRTWPKIADLIKKAREVEAAKQTAVAGTTTGKPRGWAWARAEELAAAWMHACPQPDLLDQAKEEGWERDLWQAVKSRAHAQIIARVPSDYTPALADILPDGLDDESVEYFRDRAASQAAAAEWRRQKQPQDEEAKAKREPRQWIKPGDAIRAQMAAQTEE